MRIGEIDRKPRAEAGRLMLLIFLLWQPGAAFAQMSPDASLRAEGRAGVVVCNSDHAARAGRQVLQQGGNAVDSAVTVALAMAVTWPEAGNLGGGGFMMLLAPDQPPVTIDYRECAPLSARSDMYAEGESTYTVRAVGIPGTVRGLWAAHQKYGQLPWSEVVEPARKLAADGFEVDTYLAASLNDVLESPRTDGTGRHAELVRVYGHPESRKWQAGDRLTLPDLAGTLERLADGGADAFYMGSIAEQILDEMRRGGGEITRRDLAEYQAKWREPVRIRYQEHDIFAPPPPSSGGICLKWALDMLEPMQLGSYPRQSPEALHRLTEVMRRVYCERARLLGDPEFAALPAGILDPAFPRQLAASIDPQQATPSDDLAGDMVLSLESPNTTHFSVIDRQGMAVSNTYTLEASYGSRVVVRGAGFLLNNEMGDFNWFPGRTDKTGRIGTRANRIAPRKRMLSSQTPVIVTRGGQPVMLTGSPGGGTIINTVLLVLLNRLEWEMDPVASVSALRMHHQWFPDQLVLEQGTQAPDASVVEQLRRWGHDVTWRSAPQGSAHSIFVDPESGMRYGVADGRRGGYAAAE